MSDAAVRAAFEKLYPLPQGVEWRPEENAYCVFIDAPRNGGWLQCNGAFHVQQQFKVWRVAAAFYEKEISDLRLQCGGMEQTINELSEGK